MCTKLLLCNIDNEYLFTKEYSSVGDAIKYMKKLCYSPHIRCVNYKTDAEYTHDIQYWYGRQIQYIMPRISEILGWKNYKGKEKK